MGGYPFTAVDETGKEYMFDVSKKDGNLLLTLKRETFRNAKYLFILPELAKANVGEPGFFVTPRNINMGGDLLIRFLPREDACYDYASPIMSCYGVNTPSFCGLVRMERNYKYKIILGIRDGVYSVHARFNLSDFDPVYDDIRIELILLPKAATLGDFAAAERNLRLQRGEIVPLREKCKRPAVEYARRFPLVRIRQGWKQCPSPVPHQTPENEPEMHAVVTFARVRDIADALKARGVEGAELQLVGWNISGHDGRYPQLMPPEEKLGGLRELKKTIEYVKSLGYRISLHTNTLDAVEIADCFTWDDIVIRRDGQYHQSGHWSGGDVYHVCPEKQLKNAKRELPPVAELGLNGIHFSDVISLVVPDTCHAEEHPCYTAQGIRLIRETMEYIQNTFGAFSSEGCMDFALKELDYGLYVSIADGGDNPITDTLVPFFELTYHGIVLYNPNSPTVNYPIKTPADKLTFWMRGGRPTFYFHSKFRYGDTNWMGDVDLVATDNGSLNYAAGLIAESIRETQDLAELQLVYMKDYELCGNGIEMVTYCNGTRIAGNFSEKEQAYGGTVLPPFGYAVLR